ncbi:MAG: pyridoxine 5'-phosphate synthase [Zetaproteobacteria bacterium]|nr:MAG: pyridoxine 5'-phosphate synthase [Zetaproteobacteria bacterium]
MHLGVNIDHIATLRQARLTTYPCPIQAAKDCLEAGADGITAHLREDRRHIQDKDMENLATMAKAGELHLNMEMAATDEMVAIACKLKPQAVCLVPESREELTTEGGLDVAGHLKRMTDVVARLNDAGCAVSMFIDPDRKQIEASKTIEAAVIELHTGHYANFSGEAQAAELQSIQVGAKYAAELGLVVHAGHGLTLDNTKPMVAISEIEGLNIGHAIVADALFVGIKQATADFKALMQR